MRFSFILTVAKITLVVLALLGSSCQQSSVSAADATTSVRSARDFYQSAGVNVHMSYSDTPYSDVSRVVESLRALGVSHVRDGVVLGRPDQYAALNKLAENGIRTTLIAGKPGDDPSALIATISGQLGKAVEAVEGPNEYYLATPDWKGPLELYMAELRAAKQRDSALSNVPLIGPSVREGDFSAVSDKGNFHPYPGGKDPYIVLPEEISRTSRIFGNRPLWATETGYHTATATSDSHPGVTEAAEAAYVPRLLAEYFVNGVERTYFYELIDEFPETNPVSSEKHFGLVRNDFSPKPAFVALSRLLRLVRDDDPSRPQVAFRYSVNDSGKDLQSLVLARSNGSFTVLLWRRVSISSDGTSASAPLTFSTERTFRVTTQRLSDGADANAASSARGSGETATKVMVDGSVSVLQLDP